MSVIISKEDFKIIQIDNTTFRIEFAYPNPSLINSLIRTRIIRGATASHDYKLLKFKASSIKSLKQYKEYKNTKNLSISITEATILTENLTRQLQYLIETTSQTIIGYNPENIIVINDRNFAFLGSEMITNIEENKVLISSPFLSTDFFISPELQKIKDLPSYVHYKSSYFSLACLVIYSLLSTDDFYCNYLQEEAKISEIMDCLHIHHIKYTKLYWLLSRCLVEDPEKRSILYL